MRFECKTKFEKAWLAASVAIFITYRLLEGSSPGYYTLGAMLTQRLELAMLILSFPLGGLTMFVLNDALYWCEGCRNLEFLLDWPTLLFAGYIQWFWVLPEFLRSRKLTLLDLKRLPETLSPNAAPVVVRPATPAALDAAPPRALDAAPLPAFDAAAYAPARAEFDEAGLTALDRVFQAQSPPAAQRPPSHVEAIFPGVS
jgi:hypothetical protein